MTPQTTGEINIVVSHLKEHINEKVNDINRELSSLTEQVKKTNGNVRRLQIWRSYILGALSVIVGVGVPLLVYVYKLETSEIRIKQIVVSSIREVLKNDYNIDYEH